MDAKAKQAEDDGKKALADAKAAADAAQKKATEARNENAKQA